MTDASIAQQAATLFRKRSTKAVRHNQCAIIVPAACPARHATVQVCGPKAVTGGDSLGDMSFFQRADALVSEDGLFHGTTELSLLVLVHACKQQANLRRDEDDNPTSLTMSRDAERSFRDQYDLSAAQYLALVELCDGGEGVGDVYKAYRRSLRNNVQGVAPDFVERSVTYSGVRCSNESCDDVSMRASVIRSTFYGLHECYPIKHYIKTCRGGCGATHHVNKKRQRGPDGVTWHTFYPWEEGIPLELANKSGKSILSVPLLTHVALTLSRMR